MSKKVIGVEFGIEITKPWNNEMYDHNDKVAELLKIELRNKLESIYKDGNCSKSELNVFAGTVGSKYGSGFDVTTMYPEIIKELDWIQNYQLAEDIEWYVKKNLIKQPKIGFVGYTK